MCKSWGRKSWVSFIRAINLWLTGGDGVGLFFPLFQFFTPFFSSFLIRTLYLLNVKEVSVTNFRMVSVRWMVLSHFKDLLFCWTSRKFNKFFFFICFFSFLFGCSCYQSQVNQAQLTRKTHQFFFRKSAVT